MVAIDRGMGGIRLAVADDELEIITNALAIYIEHEEDLIKEVKDRADKGLIAFSADSPQVDITEVFQGTRHGAIQLRQEIVRQLGYDPSDG